MRINRRQEEIIKILKRQKTRKYSVLELSHKLGINYNQTGRYLKSLAESGYIKRSFGAGNSYVYSYLLPGEETSTDTPTLFMDISPKILSRFLEKWSKERWTPNIFKSARNLPLSIARLYTLASEASYGSKINKNDLLEIKQWLYSFKQDLEQVLKLVNGMLLNEELWESNSFAVYLQEDSDIAVSEYVNLSEKVKEIN